MQIFPAIDLSGGQVVRLYQGDYDQMTVYGQDPCAVARDFLAAGATYLHVAFTSRWAAASARRSASASIWIWG